jgi:peptidoglycan-associated lipoprotein
MNLRSFAVFSVIFLSAACSSERKPPPRAADESVAREAPPPPVQPLEQLPATSLVVAENIREACGLPEPKAYFAYDSASVRRADQKFLKGLTDCLTKGPLQKREMKLVGHTDPRGSEGYNYSLGQRRAQNVKLAMASLGLPARQILVSSRGKLDALGSNEAGWARDRRVEVALAD